MEKDKSADISLLENRTRPDVIGGHVGNLDDPKNKCGIGRFKPRYLQAFSTIGIFTGFYSTSALISTTLLSYVNSQVTTLERQFGLSSSETGIVMASNDIGFLFVGFFIGHFARRVHIPRFMGMCTIAFGLSGLICSLPHFLYGSSQPDVNVNVSFPIKDASIQLCSLGNGSFTDSCVALDSDNQGNAQIRHPRKHAVAAMTIISIGMVLQGMAKAPRHPFTITYIDANVEKVKSGYYMGIIVSIAILGPAIAYSLGGYFTRIYVTLEDTDLYPKHPHWIGAWWLGYLVFGAAAIIIGLPLLLFPRKLKHAPPEVVAERAIGRKNVKVSNIVLHEIKDYMATLLSLISNPVYVCMVLCVVFKLFAVGGAQAFLPKYIENQFGLPAWKANLLMAGMNMAAASVGTFFGGWLTKRLKMRQITGLKFINVVSVGIIGFHCLGFVFGCPQPEILNQPGSSLVSTTPECIADSCHCSQETYLPVCGSDNRNYYSPCLAGCLESDGSTYHNCSCIPDGGAATAGLCEFDCPNLYPYCITLALTAFLSTTLLVPKFLAKVRCISEKEKGLGIALSSCMTSLFGWLLGPIVYGRVIDSTCLIWDSSCGERGSCSLYDIGDLRIKIHSFYIVAQSLSCVCSVIAMFVAMKTKIYDKYAVPTQEKMNIMDSKSEKGNTQL